MYAGNAKAPMEPTRIRVVLFWLDWETGFYTATCNVEIKDIVFKKLQQELEQESSSTYVPNGRWTHFHFVHVGTYIYEIVQNLQND